MRKPDDLEIGETVGSGRTFTLPASVRDKHLFICGGTGAGKSKLLERLIRQDIVDWPQTKTGLLLIDPHGSVYEGLIHWLAEHNLNRPVIPIDLTRSDWIPAYNLLRKRENADPSVIVGRFVEAIAHAWGKSGLTETPLFARWAPNLLRALYDKGYTLAEAVHLLDRLNTALRRAMTTGLSDRIAATDWDYANRLSPERFDEQVSSTLNRVSAFVRNSYFELALGQAEVSLDLRQALDEGHIILVSLAREGAVVSREDARLFATLLLTDLWTAAEERGKRKGVKPFRLYVDEFRHFVTPSMAEGLAAARGFGLSLTLATQFPNQLLNEGPHGKKLFDEVMENASTKLVFRLQNPENLKPLAQSLFMGVLDPDQVKHRLYATRVLRYGEEVWRDTTTGTSRSTSEGTHNGWSRAEGTSGSEHMDPEAEFVAELAAWNEVVAETGGEAKTVTEAESESTTSRRVLVPVLGQELSTIQYQDLEEQLFRAMQRLFVQEDRHCCIRVVGQRAPVFLRTLDVREGMVSEKRREEYLCRLRERWPFLLPMAEARRRLEERRKVLLSNFHTDLIDEPTTARRRVR